MNFRIIACIVLVSAYLSLSAAYAQESSTSTDQSSTSTDQSSTSADQSSTSTDQSSTSTDQSSTNTYQKSLTDKAPVTNKVFLQGGGYFHFTYDEEHTDSPWFAGVEIERSDQWIYGLGLFNNSFGQFSQYLYGGYKFKFKNTFENFHAKISAGILHGYTDEYQDKIPFNSDSGFAPAIVPGLGWKKDKWGIDAYLLGNSGLLFTLGYDVFEF